MIVLAFDTALNACSAAVVDGGRVLAMRSERMERGHQERLAPLISELMAEAGVAFAALERLGVTVGPGSFTGVRVGIAFATGLSLARPLPTVGIGTLHALAASTGNGGRVAAVIDARREQVYVQLFEAGAPLGRAQALPVGQAAAQLADASGGGGGLLVGSGAPLLAAALPAWDLDPRQTADPVMLAALTAAAGPPLAALEPLYLRAPDARTIAERATRP